MFRRFCPTCFVVKPFHCVLRQMSRRDLQSHPAGESSKYLSARNVSVGHAKEVVKGNPILQLDNDRVGKSRLSQCPVFKHVLALLNDMNTQLNLRCAYFQDSFYIYIYYLYIYIYTYMCVQHIYIYACTMIIIIWYVIAGVYVLDIDIA